MTIFLQASRSLVKPHSSVSVQFVMALMSSSHRARGLPVVYIIRYKNLALYIRDCVSLCLSEKTLKAVGHLLSGVYARGSKRSHQSVQEMCKFSWTPHSSLEKDNSLNHSCVSRKMGCLEYTN